MTLVIRNIPTLILLYFVYQETVPATTIAIGMILIPVIEAIKWRLDRIDKRFL